MTPCRCSLLLRTAQVWFNDGKTKQTTGEHRETVAYQVVGGGDSGHGEASDGQTTWRPLATVRGLASAGASVGTLALNATAARAGPSKTGEHRGERERGRLPRDLA